jgi:hypothetical protein
VRDCGDDQGEWRGWSAIASIKGLALLIYALTNRANTIVLTNIY